MNAVGIAEQESGRALGFYCSKCGRAHITMFCQHGVTEVGLVELHRKAEGCCTVTSCHKHECELYNGEACPLCVLEGPTDPAGEKQAGDGVGDHLPDLPAPKGKRARKAAAK